MSESIETRRAVSRFFLRIGQIGYAQRRRDTETLPLFTLPMILEADGTLSSDAYAALFKRPG